MLSLKYPTVLSDLHKTELIKNLPQCFVKYSITALYKNADLEYEISVPGTKIRLPF